MKIALSGSSGLIGRAIRAKLPEAVTVGRSAECDLRVDFTQPAQVKALDLAGIDVFIHAAGIVDEDFRRDRVNAYVKNTAVMADLVDRAKKAGAKAFVYISSAHVYGPLVGMLDEDSRPNPLSDYAIAHYAAEQIVRRNASPSFRGIVLRPCAVFGEPDLERFDRWSLIPFSFPREAVEQRRIVLRSSGLQRRNFLGTDDLAAEVVAQLVKGEDAFRIVNPVGLDTLSVYDFAVETARIYEEITGSACAVERPEGGGGEMEAPLDYRGRNAYHPARQSVRDFVRGFLQMLITHHAKGRFLQ